MAIGPSLWNPPGPPDPDLADPALTDEQTQFQRTLAMILQYYGGTITLADADVEQLGQYAVRATRNDDDTATIYTLIMNVETMHTFGDISFLAVDLNAPGGAAIRFRDNTDGSIYEFPAGVITTARAAYLSSTGGVDPTTT